tara:strand:+ start:733 stop:993 length:261 start_codon:yes stop_codon:yes gene_type:complete
MTEIKYMRPKDVARKYAIGLSTFWKWVGNGKLPKHHAKLSKKCTVWNAEEIDKAFEDIHDNPNPENDVLNFSRAEQSEDRKSSEIS